MAGDDNHDSSEQRDERCSSHATINPRRKRERRGGAPGSLSATDGARKSYRRETVAAMRPMTTSRSGGGAFIQLDRLFFVGFTERNGYKKLGVRLLESVRCGRCERLNPRHRNLEASEWSSFSWFDVFADINGGTRMTRFISLHT